MTIPEGDEPDRGPVPLVPLLIQLQRADLDNCDRLLHDLRVCAGKLAERDEDEAERLAVRLALCDEIARTNCERRAGLDVLEESLTIAANPGADSRERLEALTPELTKHFGKAL